MNIASEVADGDLVHGIFAGQDGYAPASLLLGHSRLITVATDAYALRRGDVGKWIETTSGSAVTITIRAEAEVPFPQLAIIGWEQNGAGQITFAAGDGVTIRSPETLKSAKQYACGSLLYKGSNVWLLGGNLEASA